MIYPTVRKYWRAFESFNEKNKEEQAFLLLLQLFLQPPPR
jgi:hypothetical protein